MKLLSSLSFMACAGMCLLYCVHLFIGIGIVELVAAFCPCVLRTKSAKVKALGGGGVVSVSLYFIVGRRYVFLYQSNPLYVTSSERLVVRLAECPSVYTYVLSPKSIPF